MANKMTKKEMFQAIREVPEVASNEAMVQFIDHEIDLLNKKRSSGKLTPTQVENEKIKEVILTTLKENVEEDAIGLTISELQKVNTELGEYSNQKLTALMRQLVIAKTVKKKSEKGSSYFSIA